MAGFQSKEYSPADFLNRCLFFIQKESSSKTDMDNAISGFMSSAKLNEVSVVLCSCCLLFHPKISSAAALGCLDLPRGHVST